MTGAGHTWLGAARLAARYAGFRLAEPKRRMRPTAERLAALPTHGLPLVSAVKIFWNDWQVPFVEAESPRDLAVGLGVVHGHLRLFQIEMMRRLAWGRLSEILGPLALDADRCLRIVGFARPVAEIERRLPDPTRDWLEGFRDGLNATIAAAREWPEEFRILAIAPEPWTLRDLIAVGRLAASDFSWKVLRRLLPLSAQPGWPDAWQRLIAEGGAATPSFSGGGGELETVFSWFNRGGSNSVAVAGARAANGAAIIASDPHLGVMLPNPWLIGGVRAPGLHAVGLMIPGVPVIALGRNRDIAWGGTSLHAASSDLFDVSDLDATQITPRCETIAVRWGRSDSVTIRDTPYGPIITDAPLLGLPADRALAMRWIGHEPNDEITAMLAVARARDWNSFRTALRGFAAPAQTMVYADVRGQVGQAVAAHLPRRRPGPPEDIVQKRSLAAHWRHIVSGEDFPSVFAPEQGFVASANNRPPASAVPVGFFFSPDDRVRRMAELVGGRSPLGIETLKQLQRDVAMPTALEMRDRILALLGPRPAGRASVVSMLTGWDGRYDAASQGALAHELMVYHLLHQLHGEADRRLYTASWDLIALLRRDLDTLPRPRLQAAAAAAARAARKDFARHRSWGALHRLRLEHPFGRVPVIGRRYRFSDHPASGGNETLLKAAHGLTRCRHRVALGQVARHISDLSDPDANDFCLLGGQDGWIGSTNFVDQYPLWRDGSYIRVPMSRAAVRNTFRHVVILLPRGESAREDPTRLG